MSEEKLSEYENGSQGKSNMRKTRSKTLIERKLPTIGPMEYPLSLLRLSRDFKIFMDFRFNLLISSSVLGRTLACWWPVSFWSFGTAKWEGRRILKKTLVFSQTYMHWTAFFANVYFIKKTSNSIVYRKAIKQIVEIFQ